jgi:hypothetical protein
MQDAELFSQCIFDMMVEHMTSIEASVQLKALLASLIPHLHTYRLPSLNCDVRLCASWPEATCSSPRPVP